MWFQFQAEEFCVLNSLNLGQRWIWGSYTLYLLYLTLYLLVVIGLSITWIKSCIYCLMSSFGMWEWPQKQAPEMALKKDPDKNFAIFTGKHLHQSLFFSKVAGVSLQLYQKKRLRCRYFIVHFTEFSRTPILQSVCQRLVLLNCISYFYCQYIN